MSPKDTAKKYYDYFSLKDATSLNSLYSDLATFKDPVFGSLNSAETRAMWSMLLGRAENLSCSHRILNESGELVEGEMLVEYEFGKKKRKVLNHILTRFVIRDGKILDQKDRFNFWRWCTMAFGTVGFAIGWIPFFREKIKKKAQDSLKLYIQKNNL